MNWHRQWINTRLIYDFEGNLLSCEGYWHTGPVMLAEGEPDPLPTPVPGLLAPAEPPPGDQLADTPPDPPRGGAPDKTWRNTFSDEVKADPAFDGFGNVQDALTGYSNLFKKMGAGPDNLLRLPASDAPESDWVEIHTRLGRPKEPTDYKVPEGIKTEDEGFLNTLKAGAHAAGMSQKQFSSIVKSFETAELDMSTRETASHGAKLEELKKTAATDLQIHYGREYPEKNALIGRVANGMSEGLRGELEATGTLYNPEFLKMLADLGSLRMEDGSRGGEALGVADSLAEIKRLGLDAEFQKALANSDHPEHKNALKRKNELYENAYPNELSGPGYANTG